MPLFIMVFIQSLFCFTETVCIEKVHFALNAGIRRHQKNHAILTIKMMSSISSINFYMKALIY